jgi:hypothetical protein
VVEFLHLTADVRAFMLAEFDADRSADRLGGPGRRSDSGRASWHGLLREALAARTSAWLARELDESRALLRTEMQYLGGRMVPCRVPDNAAALVAEQEFNRFYVRGVCRAALERDGGDALVVVCRGTVVPGPRSLTSGLVGRSLRAADLLDDLRSSVGALSCLGLPGGLGVGNSVRLPDARGPARETLQGRGTPGEWYWSRCSSMDSEASYHRRRSRVSCSVWSKPGRDRSCSTPGRTDLRPWTG